MIIPNAKIQFKAKTAGGIDPETGYARKGTSDWGEAIDCQVVAKAFDWQARNDQQAVTKMAYSVYLDGNIKAPSEQVKIIQGKEEQEFSARSIEYLQAVDQTLITL